VSFRGCTSIDVVIKNKATVKAGISAQTQARDNKQADCSQILKVLAGKSHLGESPHYTHTTQMLMADSTGKAYRWTRIHLETQSYTLFVQRNKFPIPLSIPFTHAKQQYLHQ
jgi:hypothetical protein